jgi:sugar lactone lactonase YvrE
MQYDISLVDQLDVSNILGEGVIWDERNQTLYWTDIESRKFYSWGFSAGVRHYDCPERLCSFGLTEESERFICAFESGFAFFKPLSAEITWISKVESDLPYTRLNDGRVDRQGRFWAGSYVEDKGSKRGALYRLEKDGQATRIISNVRIANSLCWSPDAQTMYFSDTPTQTIQRADFDPATGSVHNLSHLITTNQGAYPDGSCIDSQGYLWNAQWGSSKVKRYDPQGREVLSLDLPCKQPSCVSFGGPNLQHLFVTSARKGLQHQEIKQQPGNGSLFIFATPFMGIAESVCSLY